MVTETLSGECVSPQFDYCTEIIKPRILLHSCCGPCSTAVVEYLALSYSVTVYFYNPNITDPYEYGRRLEGQKKFIDGYNRKINRIETIGFVEGKYEPECFYYEAIGLENEAEGGERCRRCFRMRLESTAAAAKLGGYDCFATTLSVSPHKNYGAIREIGCDVGARYAAGFVDQNFSRNGGYARSVELSKEYSLYRQNYCGCEFSKGAK